RVFDFAGRRQSSGSADGYQKYDAGDRERRYSGRLLFCPGGYGLYFGGNGACSGRFSDDGGNIGFENLWIISFCSEKMESGGIPELDGSGSMALGRVRKGA